MGQRAAELVDGGGAARVVATMRERGIRVRRAEAGDCRILFEWANDAAVRQASFASAAISWDEHSRWFAEKMRDRASMILMFEEGDPAGTVRFQFKDGGDAEISVTVAPEFRGQGLAAHFLERAVEFAFEHSAVERIQAFIRTGNRVSAKAFEQAGFFLVGTTNVKGKNALHYTREREEVVVEPGNSRAVEMARCR
jgi:RimJ/RimL family protein N-acetyltransferase